MWERGLHSGRIRDMKVNWVLLGMFFVIIVVIVIVIIIVVVLDI